MSSGQVSGVLSVSEEESRVDPIQVARRCSKVFQILSASLVRVGDVQGVSRRHAVRGKKKNTYGGFLGGGVEKVGKFIEVLRTSI